MGLIPTSWDVGGAPANGNQPVPESILQERVIAAAGKVVPLHETNLTWGADVITQINIRVSKGQTPKSPEYAGLLKSLQDIRDNLNTNRREFMSEALHILGVTVPMNLSPTVGSHAIALAVRADFLDSITRFEEAEKQARTAVAVRWIKNNPSATLNALSAINSAITERAKELGDTVGKGAGKNIALYLGIAAFAVVVIVLAFQFAGAKVAKAAG